MANDLKQNKAKKIMGFILIGLSLSLFILSIIPNFVTTNFFMGIFGIVWYVYLLVMLLLGIGNAMGLKFFYTRKFTVRVVLTMFFLVAILHTIFTNQALANCYRFDDYIKYLSYCYNLTDGATVGGAFIGIFTYFIKAVVGIIGVYCILVILFSLFAGLVLDHLISNTAKRRKKKRLPERPKNQFIIPEEDRTASQATTEEPINSASNIESTEFSDVFDTSDNLDKDFETKSNGIFSSNQSTNRYYDMDLNNSNNSDTTRVKSAREMLFGPQDVPDVTMQNDRQRDMFMRNYREENNISEENNEKEDSISTLFGGRQPQSRIAPEPQNDRLSRFDRNARDTSSINVDLNSADDDNDFSIKPIGADTMSDRGRLSRNPDRMNNSVNLDSRNNGFRDIEDVAKPAKIDFSQTIKPEPVAKQEKPQGKQMGMAPIRYNGIPISTFKVYKEDNADYSEEYRRKSAALEKVMNEFDIGAKVINVVRGPKVTRYEMSLPAGVSTTKVTSIASNISMALESRSQIRIEAPIPGKNAIGIELENDKPSMVGMRELLESPEFAKCKDPLPIAIGKDINGRVIIKSLPKMIHLLVAGSSGSGKSIFIHSVMMSILYKYSPDEVRFVMVDPKRVEFTMYNNLPHLMFPDVLYEHDKALNALKWAVDEMMKRYDLLRKTECQNLEQYNKIPEVTSGELPKMPYLVVVVDELAELMSGPLKKDFENAIQRITQLGRAAGMHMVVATQRPSVDVVTGTIKNNFSTRVAFALASSADSRTVLDEIGAESLLGHGDMLFAPQDSNTKIRLQAAFCDNDEIRNAIKYVKENNQATYDENVVNLVYSKKDETGEGDSSSSDGGIDAMDDYMKQAVKFAKDNGKVSVSLLQRKFRIGFNRAARIVDQMEELGLVGPSVGSRPRDFNITDEQFEELFGPDDDSGDNF